MTTFICDCSSCKYYDVFGDCCAKAVLNILDFCNDGTPNCFRSILSTPEYRQEYWITINERGKIYRRLTHGKSIRLNGFELFTREHIPPEDTLNEMGAELPASVKNIICTESNTGLLVRLDNVYDCPEKVKAMIDQQPNVMSYPIWIERAKFNED